jgi:hypothetical protein
VVSSEAERELHHGSDVALGDHRDD